MSNNPNPIRKIAIIGDVHFGHHSNKQLYQNIQDVYFNIFLYKILEKNPEISDLFILGDVFDNRNILNVKTINLALRIFQHLSERVRIHCLLGNHDVYYTKSKKIHSLDIFNIFDTVAVYSDISTIAIDNRKILLIPWIQTAEDREAAISAIKSAKENDIDLILTHNSINNFEMVRHYQERNGLLQEIFPVRTFAGHFHLRDTKGNVTYVGSPYEITWNDAGNQKGVYIVNLRNMEEKFIPNEISPKHIKIYTSQAEQDFSTLTGHFIKIIIDNDISEADLLKLKTKIESCDIMSCSIESEFENIPQLADGFEITEGPRELLIEFIKTIQLPKHIDLNKLVSMIEYIHEKASEPGSYQYNYVEDFNK